jgi:two-component system response regulator MprA
VHILIVDDEPALRDSLSRTLRFEGYTVEVAANGAEALDAVHARQPDCVVLDMLMPVQDGLATCRVLRAEGNLVPVLMLTARSDVGDRVAGLDAGADDYLVKPFSLQELLARVRALLRRTPAGRSGGGTAPPGGSGRLTFADLSLDPQTWEVRRGSRTLGLTRTEFSLLETFLRNPRRVLPRPLLLEQVWGYDFGPTSNGLDVYVGYLRRKLEADGEPRLLHTIRGVGYVLREEP